MHDMAYNAPGQTTQRVLDRQRTGLRMPLTSSARRLSRAGAWRAGEAAMTGMRGEESGGMTLPGVFAGGVLLFSCLSPFIVVSQVDEEFVTQWSRTIFLKGLKRS
uniref:Uncharacterized protein n=1 Tax=Thermogemmatispora argillosa TaxID=2045280 RepID=A0A455T0X3_9CHLR|nr:hypothetical protein KTA_12100 [Thermogemmatispora argillosa]